MNATNAEAPSTVCCEPETEEARLGGSLDELADLCSALAEPKRLGILAQLASGEHCACDLTGCCGDRQPLLSFHLKKLREAGLVRARKEGRWMHYALDREALSRVSEALVRLAEGGVEPDCC